MKKYYILICVVGVVGVAFFAYISLFLQRVTVLNVNMPSISYRYENLSANHSIVFVNEATGNWYMDRNLSGSGEITTMIPAGTPHGTYVLSILDTQAGKFSAKSESFTYASDEKPIVTINQNSLKSSSRNPVISGTAQNISDIAILVEDKSSQRYFGGEVDLNGSTWMVTLNETELPKGEYKVQIFNSRDDSQGVLATGKLLVQ